MWSYSPSAIALKERIVSSTGTNEPGCPVNASATNMFCERKRWIRRARGRRGPCPPRRLVDTENRDDVPQVPALQDLLHPRGDSVVLVTDDVRVQNARGRVERVHRGVDAELGNRPAQHRGGVKVRERGVRRRVRDVVSGHVNGLQRGDGVPSGGGDALLEVAPSRRPGWAGNPRPRHPAEQGGHLGAGLGESEDVVDEQQHVLLLHVAEVLGHGQRRQRHPEPGARRLVHLTEDQRGLGDDARLGHLKEQVVALAGASPTREHRHTTEVLRNSVDHLLDQHRLAHPAPPNRPIFPPLTYGGQQVDDLDAGLENLGLGLGWSKAAQAGGSTTDAAHPATPAVRPARYPGCSRRDPG